MPHSHQKWSCWQQPTVFHIVNLPVIILYHLRNITEVKISWPKPSAKCKTRDCAQVKERKEKTLLAWKSGLASCGYMGAKFWSLLPEDHHPLLKDRPSKALLARTEIPVNKVRLFSLYIYRRTQIVLARTEMYSLFILASWIERSYFWKNILLSGLTLPLSFLFLICLLICFVTSLCLLFFSLYYFFIYYPCRLGLFNLNLLYSSFLR